MPLADRRGRHPDRKRALARAAASLVEPGGLLFLDHGSSNLALAERLPARAGLTVATASIPIAAVLAARADPKLLMIGGAVDTQIGGSVDGMALEGIGRLNIDVCVLGACGLSVDDGVSAFDPADAAFKRALVSRSRSVLLLAANEKLEERAPHRVAATSALSWVVIEHDAPEAAADALRQSGVAVLRAQPPSDIEAEA